MTAGFVLVAIGLFFLWIGWSNWRNRGADKINIIEAVVLKIGGSDAPLPKTGFDKFLAYVQAFLGFLFGIAALGGGLAIVLNDWGIL